MFGDNKGSVVVGGVEFEEESEERPKLSFPN